MSHPIAAFIRSVLIDLAVSLARRLLLFARRLGGQSGDGTLIPV